MPQISVCGRGTCSYFLSSVAKLLVLAGTWSENEYENTEVMVMNNGNHSQPAVVGKEVRIKMEGVN